MLCEFSAVWRRCALLARDVFMVAVIAAMVLSVALVYTPHRAGSKFLNPEKATVIKAVYKVFVLYGFLAFMTIVLPNIMSVALVSTPPRAGRCCCSFCMPAKILKPDKTTVTLRLQGKESRAMNIAPVF